MIARFNEKLHIVEVWLTQEDQQDASLMASLPERYQVWNRNGYRPVLFRSGSRDLQEDMLVLLKDWRMAEAARQTAAEKTAVKETSCSSKAI